MTRTRYTLAAWIILGLLFAGILTDVALHPNSHTTMPTYRLAATEWWQAVDPYTQRAHDGFLYFPQAAVIFTPFNLPGFAGDLLWRMATFGLFLYALLRLHRSFLAGKDGPAGFLIFCLLAVPSSMASLRNAQFDLPLAALIVLTVAEISAARWTVAAIWLCLAVALKPLAVVPLLLFGALYGKQLLPRIALGLFLVAALPFLHWNTDFVTREYGRCYETLRWAAQGNEARYSDLAALLSHVGYNAPDGPKTVVRLVFALVYFGLGVAAIRRLDRVEAAWMIGALSADYLMLFNPRTETCSYVFLGPFVASLALVEAALPGRKWLGWIVGLGALCLACDAFPKIGAFSIHDLTDRWLKPLVALLFLPVLIHFIWEKRPRQIAFRHT